jgi:hypothetical protein
VNKRVVLRMSAWENVHVLDWNTRVKFDFWKISEAKIFVRYFFRIFTH